MFGDTLSEYIVKINTPGSVLCSWCQEPIKYGSSGKGNQVIAQIHEKSAKKKFTEDGKRRIQRIVEKLFYERTKTTLLMGMYIDILSVFKSFLLTLEKKEPMIHRLHDEIKCLVKEFLMCFIAQENLKDLKGTELANIVFTDEKIQCRKLFIGGKAERHRNEPVVLYSDECRV